MELMKTTFFLLCLVGVQCLHNGVGLTPAMGYNTWNDYRCNLKAQDVIDVTNAFVKMDLAKYGYEYINIDDCWAKGRYSNGTVYPDSTTFPQGVKAVADYVHSKGYKFGIYTDRGTETCAGRPGSYDHETIDAQTYADWGVDYLKEDSCHASGDHQAAFNEYGKMRDALNATGRHIYFSLCGWNPWYAPPGATLGNSWRISGDVNRWDDVLRALGVNAPLYPYASVGSWNDPDMLVGSSPTSAAHMEPVQSRAQFTFWSIMAAPLLIGSSIVDLPPYDLETYTNSEIIAVDQDSLGIQGQRIVYTSNTQIWTKPLSDGSWVMGLLNFGTTNTTITCDQTCWKTFKFTGAATVRDLWAHKDLPNASGSFTTPMLEANGGHMAVKLKAM